MLNLTAPKVNMAATKEKTLAFSAIPTGRWCSYLEKDFTAFKNRIITLKRKISSPLNETKRNHLSIFF
jgi:hypothetical protein